MTHNPRTEDNIYQSLKSSLTGKIGKLTNFTERSFNYVWTRAFASDLRELEMKVLASELSGWIDYSGGPLTQQDLEDLGIEDEVDVSDLEPFLTDEQLEQFVKIVGVSRLPGSRATGSVTITTRTGEDVTIDEGTVVGTRPQEDGDNFRFETTEQADAPVGTTTVADVSIQAIEVGPDYNVPADSIVRFESPPIGVTGVTNPEATDGGEGEETNAELRERAKNAVAEQSGGGTVEGIKGFIVSNVEGVREGDVILEEFPEGGDGPDGLAPYVDVIVDGGVEQQVLDAIEESRPAAIRHELVRPEVAQIRIDAALNGTDIDKFRVEENLEEYLLALGISDTFYKNQIIKQIMRSDEDILNIGQLELYVQRVTNETFTFDTTQDRYDLEYTHNGDDVTVTDEDGTTYVEGSNEDYELINVARPSNTDYFDTIEWKGNDEPDNGDEFFIDYDVNQETRLVRDEQQVFDASASNTFQYDTSETDYELVHAPIPSTLSVTDPEAARTYTEGTDYDLVSVVGQDEVDTFEYQSGRREYQLDYSTEASSVSITDASGDSYTQGTDYTVVDKDADGLSETIRWDTSNTTPDAEERFTVNYSRQNGIPQTIRWNTSNTTPSDNEAFDVSYEQRVYSTDLEIVDAPNDKIVDASGDSFTEDTDYEFVDYNADGEDDAVSWIDPSSTSATSPDDGETYYLTYYTEGDLNFSNRQKADPGSISVTVQ